MSARSPRRGRTAAVVLAAGALALTTAAPAAAVDSPEDLPAPTPQQLAASVQVWSTEGSVRTLETVATEGAETTISLATDILFASQSYELPASAAPRIGQLLADVPDGAAVQVHGHTDSLVGPIPNDELSRNRAQAVADVIAAERPDLVLEVAGFADTEPVGPENPDDPATYAANRRVEIVYGG
ncbi:OmpA family protein [Georgenia faecalis]|uniref:OmpA family protein n=1 Tax=Georgenia faecalis TaxID=2483799 RepID=A0ABV9D9R8_9MICO|nr:OmpA family protein [Georgenia faecalis]